MARKKIAHHIIGAIFKGLCTLVIVGVVGLLAFNIITMYNIPKSLEPIQANEKLAEAYKENDGKLTMFTQDFGDNITRDEHNNGYFAVVDPVYIEEAEQLQFILRYNNSTIEHLQKDYELPSLPDRGEDLYDVSIVIKYDLTPDNDKDNLAQTGKADEGEGKWEFERILPTDSARDSSSRYNYVKYTFDGVDTENVIGIDIQIFYKGDIYYQDVYEPDDKPPYGYLTVYDYRAEKEEYKLTKDDVEAIEAWGK